MTCPTARQSPPARDGGASLGPRSGVLVAAGGRPADGALQERGLANDSSSTYQGHQMCWRYGVSAARSASTPGLDPAARDSGLWATFIRQRAAIEIVSISLARTRVIDPSQSRLSDVRGRGLETGPSHPLFRNLPPPTATGKSTVLMPPHRLGLERGAQPVPKSLDLAMESATS